MDNISPIVSRPLDVWIALICCAMAVFSGASAVSAQQPAAPCTREADENATPGEETKLEACDGVLKPPAHVDPEMHLPSPDPQLGELPVLPPPVPPATE